MKIVILGLSITSSWGNGHATTYRALVAALAARGHDVLFLEREQPWYAENRDLESAPFCRVELYRDLPGLKAFANEVAEADCVIVGSFVPEGVAVGKWVTAVADGVVAFYDIDTPVTLGKLERGDYEYLAPALIPAYDYYLSFTGGPTLGRIEKQYGSPAARPFYCSVDPALYFPTETAPRWDLGYLGTYSDDRQPTLTELLIEPAKTWTQGRFAVVGPQYPASVLWPPNVERIEHLSPREHGDFYNAQRFTLNVTRQEMIRAGWSPSVRLFEAAACGVPIISDIWDGLDQFFTPGEEILLVQSRQEVTDILRDFPEAQRQEMARRARARVLAEHTADHRAGELEALVTGFPEPRVTPADREAADALSQQLS